MLKAIGTKLILRPAPKRTSSDGGIALPVDPDVTGTKLYFVISAGPKVTIEGLSHGCTVLCTAYEGQSFEFEGHPLKIVDEKEILMLL
jgi:co-chaperonin GroES (HSP10)